VQRSVFLSGDGLNSRAVADLTAELGASARQQLGDEQAELSAVYELRYRGQAFELAVSGALRPDPDQLRNDFEAQHEDRYGYRDPEQELELVTLRVSATIPGPEVSLGGDTGGEPERSRRPARVGGVHTEVEVLGGSPQPGTTVSGPAVFELAESTLLVPAGWSGEVDDDGTIHLSS
jgi:N-methylhydantoinase A